MDLAENITKLTVSPEIQEDSFKDHYHQPLQNWKEFIKFHVAEDIQIRAQFLLELSNFIDEKVKALSSNQKAGTALVSSHKEVIFQHIKSFYDKPNTLPFDELHKAWQEKAKEIVAELPVRVSKPQLAERFQAQPGERLLKVFKFFKRWFFYFSRIHLYILNIFHKNKINIEYWQHSPRLRGLFQLHFIKGFMGKWMMLDDKIEREFCRLVMEIKKWEEINCLVIDPVEIPDLVGDWSVMHGEAMAEIEAWFETTVVEFEKELELSGTMEYLDSRLEQKSLDRRFLSDVKKWNRNHRNWVNTSHALFEDWRSDLELGGLHHYVSHCITSLTETFDQWAQKSKKDFLSPILSYLSQTKSKFTQLKGTELAKLISQTRYQIKKALDLEMIKPLQERLTKNTMLSHMDKVEHLLRERIKSLQQAYAAVKSASFDQALDSDELYSVSNFELISFEIQPRYEEKLDNIKNELLIVVNELLIQAGDVDEVVTFTLNTALDNLKNEKSNSEECEGIINEGFDRASQKVKEVDQRLEEILKTCRNEFISTLDQLKTSIWDLTETENVSAIRMRISKAKAIRQSIALKHRLLSTLKKLIKMLALRITEAWNHVQSWRKQIEQMLIPSASSAVPSRDVSDFLNESNQIIENLPVIYRRLYTIEPLVEPMLFEGREKEIETVNKAFDQWRQGRFGSVLISGEMWSGLTSLINYLLSQNNFPHPIHRHIFEDTITEPGELYSLLAKIFNKDNFQSISEVVEYLNTSDKKIIILEDLQHLYLRKINGLKALMELIEIIAATHKRVFWIATLSSYAAQFLEKNIHISGFFSYPISLADFSAEQISNLVIKRNRISGFKILFEAGKSDLKDKRFLKLDENGKQNFLKTRFFKELNSFARHNVSLALLYWLLSTKKVTKNTIIISNFKKLDLSFLLLLSSERIFVLHCLILHDGLKAEQITEVLSLPPQQVNMLLLAMEEDGILYQDKEVFMVHPLVYRGVIQLLKSKNLLY